MFDTADNRAAPRRKTLKGGRIIFNAGRSTIDCTIRDLSSTGAKLQVNSVVGIPNTFDLSISGVDRQPCKVVWRSLRELGVEFQPKA
ncbi:MAG: PilZ domain-containing protein [Devosia sp.]